MTSIIRVRLSFLSFSTMQKAEFLSKTFSSVFTKENLNNIPSINKHVGYNIEPLVISTNGVAAQLQALNPNKSTGADQIPPWFMKEHANVIAPVLTNIFQESINSGVVPQGWKNANVTAVFKKGKKTDPSNYRPISLTSVASKVLEHIVHSHIMKFFEEHSILTDMQHGFRAKRSTTTQLIHVIHEMSKSIDENATVHAVILDFEKAFDKVPPPAIVKKTRKLWYSRLPLNMAGIISYRADSNGGL